VTCDNSSINSPPFKIKSLRMLYTLTIGRASRDCSCITKIAKVK